MSKQVDAARGAHTPGPWAFHSWGKASGTRYGIETADHRHGIAGVSPNENASTLLSMECHEANARLIAAAPELLAACQSLMRAEGMQRGERGGCTMGEISQAIDLARAAIAKAIGHE